MKKQFGPPLYMIISAFFFALMGAAVKYADSIPFIQKVFFRNFVMILMVLPSLLFRARNRGIGIFLGERKNRPKLLLRSCFGFFGVVLFFFSVERLNLGDSAMLNRLSAFFVIIMSAIFLGEKIKLYQIPALMAAFAGALLIIKPGFRLEVMPAIAGTVAAVLAAAAYTTIASLKGKEDSLTIIFWFSIVSTIASLVPMLICWKTPAPAETLALVLTGIFAAGGQYFLTLAYTGGRAGEVSIYNYTNVVFSLLIGFFLWREIPDLLSITGSILIAGSAVGLYIRGRKNVDV